MYEVMSAVATAWSDSQVLLLLLLYPLFLFLGVFFLLALVQDHGSVTAAASAVVRKLASFSISYIYFGRPMSAWVVAGAVLVFSSVGFKALVHSSECLRTYASVVDLQPDAVDRRRSRDARAVE